MGRKWTGLLALAAAVAAAASNPAFDVPGAPALPAAVQARPYALKLASLYVRGLPFAGLLVKARIDGGPVLRLLLDSGAQQIVLDRRAAARSGISGSSDLDLVGVGPASRRTRLSTGRTVKVEGLLELRDCGVIVLDGKVLDGIDGIMPLSVFSGFQVRLDIPGKTLALTPYGQGEAPVEAVHGLLFVKALLNDSTEGQLLLDTGAFYNAISEGTARALGLPRWFGSAVSVQGGGGVVQGTMFSSQVRFRLGSRVLLANHVVVLPFDELQRRQPMEVAGVLGFPALRDSVITIDYRSGSVNIDRK